MGFRPRGAAIAVTTIVLMLLVGCSSDGWTMPHPAPTAVGALGKDFVPTPAPIPEGTMSPAPGSWDGVHPSRGFRVVLLTAGDDGPTKALVSSVKKWASDEDVDLRTVTAGAALVDAIVKAIDLNPDLIISAGNDLVDPLATVTASHLDQQFLVIGAELAEPTQNVTAVDWAGASFRGEGLGASSTYDEKSFTARRCDRAVRAGVAAVLNHVTGFVIWLD